MKKTVLTICALALTAGLGLSACSSDDSADTNYNAGYQQQNTMAMLPPQTQMALMADMQQNPSFYRQQPGETYNAYEARIGNRVYPWMTPEELRNHEYRYMVSSAAIQQATYMGLVEARANNMMWDEAVKTERAQANIWDARADTQYSKRRINRDKVGMYSDTTHGISSTVGGVSDTFRNTKSMLDNFKSIFK